MHRLPRVIILVSALALAGAGTTQASWVTARVERGGTYNSIAVDSLGHPHIAFLDDSNPADYTLKRAFVDAQGNSHIETVDSGDVGWHCAMAIDAADHVHITYHADKPASTLKYAYFDGSQWTFTTVDDGGWANSIALDPAGHPHIVYVQDGSLGTLRHAWFDGSNWSHEEIGTGAIWFGRTGLAVAPNGKLHVSYSDDSLPRKLFYATDDSGSWVTTEIGHGRGSSLALAPNGLPRVVSLDEDSNVLEYRAYDGMSWHTTPVESTGEAGYLAIDAGGLPHVAVGVTNVSDVSLGYATWDSFNQLFTTRILPGRDRGYLPSLALDKLGLPHIATRRAIGSSSFLQYTALVKPEVTVAWSGVTSGMRGASHTVTSSLMLGNEGSGGAFGFKARFYLSDDDAYDPLDLPIGKPRKVPTIRPGDTAELAIKIRSKTPLAGKHLIAVVSGFEPDIDVNNNTAAALIP